MRLSATAVAIVDTPIFQRLRYLKQLGTTGEDCSACPGRRRLPRRSTSPPSDKHPWDKPPPASDAEYVYPGATHTRFAHSLGVAHRARELALRLAERQPELALSDSDLVVLEVGAAGAPPLCAA